MNRTQRKRDAVHGTEQRTRLLRSPAKNASSQLPHIHQVALPRGLDPWNVTTWSIVQRDPQYEHLNISLVARFFREFMVHDLVLATELQMEEDAKMVQRAKQNLVSLLLWRNASAIPGNTSRDDCLQKGTHDHHNSHTSNAFSHANAKSNVDSLIRLQDMLGFPVCWLDPVIRNRIAPWSTIVDKYGSDPRIIGLDQCQSFQKSFPKLEDRWLAVAGLFHSGTNLLFALLSEHCDMRPKAIPTSTTTTSTKLPKLQFRPNRGMAEKFEGVAWQVTWGKHNPAHKRDSFTCASVPGKVIVPDITKAQQLPVVVIRHPYPWMESMCHQPYSTTFVTPTGQSDCPHRVTHEPGTNQSIAVNVQYGSGDVHYESVAHMYNEWYQEYLFNATFPRLAVRMEDLIHHPRAVIQQVCECAGGIFDWNITDISASISIINATANSLPDQIPSWALLLGSVKEGMRGHNTSHSSGFLKAWMEPKLKLVSQATKQYTRRVLDSKLMELFHYQL